MLFLKYQLVFLFFGKVFFVSFLVAMAHCVLQENAVKNTTTPTHM